jgi:CHAT domain-containing protein
MKSSPLCTLLGGFGTLLMLVSFAPVRVSAASHPADAAPEQYTAQGLHAFQRGDFGQAVVNWAGAARLYKQQQQPKAQSAVLTQLSQAYQALGQYRQALAHLETARALAEQGADRSQLAAVLGSLGNVYIATGPAEQAGQYLRQALALAQELRSASLVAGILNNLGNLYTSQNKPHDAFAAYKDSVGFARNAGDHVLVAQALTNAATAASQDGQYRESSMLLDEAWEQMQRLEPVHNKAYGLIKIGLGYDQLRTHLPDLRDALLLRASTVFYEAVKVAQTISELRAASYAWGYLGHLYEREQRHQEALELTRRAVFTAQQVYAPESLYRWQWQAGRLLKVQGHLDAAIVTYRRAVETLQALRPELSTSYGKPPTSFRESVGRVYFELVDLLLQRAASLPERSQYVPYLHEAQQTVELFKAAELRDFFRDDCVDAFRSRITPLDVVSHTAAIVYPIPLQERLELLVSLPTGLTRFAVPVGEDTLAPVVRAFRRALQTGAVRRSLQHAQRLYDWLIRPLEADLAALHIDTLVFVPDGTLRTIPLAALHDGVQFLIHKYALATTPGLDLTDPRPIPRERVRVLAGGLAEAVQGFAALPHVSAELQAIQRLYKGKVLLNQDFLLSSVEKALRKEDFGIVHIASHGHFASDAAQSFLLTFDGKLTMDRLAQYVGLLRFRDQPLELLTLSACETAMGDDRAALGLAGVAIKAGARSALATLWRVQDEATAILVTEFYRQLQEPTVSRARALQHAQLKLLNDPRYQDPFFWSPFLLLNNWF